MVNTESASAIQNVDITKVTNVVKTVEPCDVSTMVADTLKGTEVRVSGGRAYEFAKRFLDVVLSLFAIVVLSPLLLVVCLGIYLEDRGSPIFVQDRYTKDGKVFKMYKFRSMCVNAEARFHEVAHMNEMGGNIAFKVKDDPRVTKIGRFIRKTSIDELPQLFNILSGDMSIVGPRPPITREVAQYTPHHMDRLLVKGGLTCFWQCGGRNELGFEEQVDLDIEYIETRSLWVDAKIVLKTVQSVLRMRGAS